MPTYVYRREDETTFEVEQRITEDALETCPTTGQAVQRVITGGTGLIFKGSGFYLTDYARSNGKKSEAGSDKATEKTSDTSEKTTASSEKSTEAKATTSKSDE